MDDANILSVHAVFALSTCFVNISELKNTTVKQPLTTKEIEERADSHLAFVNRVIATTRVMMEKERTSFTEVDAVHTLATFKFK